MNEDIKKIEISEDKLEDVSGGEGSAGSVICPRCYGEMTKIMARPSDNSNTPRYVCLACKFGL